MIEFTKEGKEICDQTPMSISVRSRKPLTIQEIVRMQIRSQVSSLARSKGYETFEEADDFEVGDDDELKSQYELQDEVGRPADRSKQTLETTKKALEEAKQSTPKSKALEPAKQVSAAPADEMDDQEEAELERRAEGKSNRRKR